MNRKYKDAVSHIRASDAMMQTVLNMPNTQKKSGSIPLRRWGIRGAAVAVLAAILILSGLPKADTNLLTIAVMAEGQDPQYLEYMVDNSAVSVCAERPAYVLLNPFGPFMHYFDPISQEYIALTYQEQKYDLLFLHLELNVNASDTRILLEHNGVTLNAGENMEELALYEPVEDPETGERTYTVWGRFVEQDEFTISVYYKDRLIQQKVIRVTPVGDPMEYFEYDYQIEIISNVDLR